MYALVAASGEKISIGVAAIEAVLGYAVVFFGLVLLMVVVILMGKVMVARSKKAAKAVETPAIEAPAPAPAPALPEAPGAAGELILKDVSERDAAVIMAIVAHKLQKPLNELRFKSITEVK